VLAYKRWHSRPRCTGSSTDATPRPPSPTSHPSSCHRRRCHRAQAVRDGADRASDRRGPRVGDGTPPYPSSCGGGRRLLPESGTTRKDLRQYQGFGLGPPGLKSCSSALQLMLVLMACDALLAPQGRRFGGPRHGGGGLLLPLEGGNKILWISGSHVLQNKQPGSDPMVPLATR
jgi:hypothetical protein